MVDKEVKEVKPKEEYKLVEVPTGSALAFQTPEGEIFTMEQLLVQLANEIREVKKAVI